MDTWNSKRSMRPSTLPPVTYTSASSRPVGIPSRSQRNRENERPHVGIPPAVAALLAVTTIPPPRKSRSARRKRAQDVFNGPSTPPSSFDLDVSIREDLAGSPPEDMWQTTSKAALELLLSPPEEIDDAFDQMSSSPSGELLSLRSDSSESVPSLETDSESTFSFSSCGSQPWNARRRSAYADSRARIISSPPEECHSDHPLMFAPENNISDQPETIASDDLLRRVTGSLNFKSNLTASLRVLRSAAKSFSSLTASALQSDDYITRSILSISPQYTDEKRPARSQEVPTPAVRRYLNPWATTYDESPCAGAVQMQTYNTGESSKSSSARRNSDPESPSCACTPMVRQREVRENADFLRVIVLEMNMRRGGKLSETAPGKARLVLPPRQPYRLRAAGDDTKRWESWTEDN